MSEALARSATRRLSEAQREYIRIDIDDPSGVEKLPHTLSPTLQVKTPGGGSHVYFIATPDSDALGNRNVLRIGDYVVPDAYGRPTCLLELKVHNVTVAAAGSRNSEGISYKPVAPYPPALLPMPSWLVDWIKEYSETPRFNGGSVQGRATHPTIEAEDFFEWYKNQGAFTVGDAIDKGEFDLEAVQTELDGWKQPGGSIVDAYGFKTISTTRDEVSSIAGVLCANRSAHCVLELQVFKYWYDPTWGSGGMPDIDLITDEFAISIPFRVRWSAMEDRVVTADVLRLSSC